MCGLYYYSELDTWSKYHEYYNRCLVAFLLHFLRKDLRFEGNYQAHLLENEQECYCCYEKSSNWPFGHLAVAYIVCNVLTFLAARQVICCENATEFLRSLSDELAKFKKMWHGSLILEVEDECIWYRLFERSNFFLSNYCRRTMHCLFLILIIPYFFEYVLT